jgi:hypothetical protein
VEPLQMARNFRPPSRMGDNVGKFGHR